MITTKKDLLKALEKVKTVDELHKVDDNLSDSMSYMLGEALDNLDYELLSNQSNIRNILHEYMLKCDDFKNLNSNINNLKYDLLPFRGTYKYVLVTDNQVLNYDKEDNFKKSIAKIITEVKTLKKLP